MPYVIQGKEYVLKKPEDYTLGDKIELEKVFWGILEKGGEIRAVELVRIIRENLPVILSICLLPFKPPQEWQKMKIDNETLDKVVEDFFISYNPIHSITGWVSTVLNAFSSISQKDTPTT